MSDDLDALRAKYKEALGKNAFNGWDAAELQKRIDDHNAAGNDGAADGDEPAKPAREPRGKAKDDAPKSTVPYPTQDDLDAMRAGTYQNRQLKSR
jgi:hypothetical protein